MTMKIHTRTYKDIKSGTNLFRSHYKHRIYVAVCVMIVICMTSCTQTENAFTRVSDYYSNDTLKHQAALFLEKYAAFHYGVGRHIVDSLGRRSRLTPKRFPNDSVYRAYLDNHHYRNEISRPVLDADTITDKFLIENIDLAFDAWRKPWAKNISFNDFCQYILPYRNGDEELSRWRPRFKQEYEHLITDSMMSQKNIRDIAEFLMRQIRKKVGYGTRFNGLIQGFLTPAETEQLGHVECKACANYAAMVMRACGIPCEVIEMHWRFTEVPHSSVLFPKTANNPRAFRLTIGDTLIIMGEPKDSMAAWRTWAYTYPCNDQLLKMAESKDVPRAFALPVFRKDVTALTSKTFNLTLPVPDSLKHKAWLFLCRFHNWKWYAIREGQVTGDKAQFTNVTIRQLYRLGFYTGDSIQTFGPLFTLTGKGRVQPYTMSGDTVRFKIAYGCDNKETRLNRYITTWTWNSKGILVPIQRKCPLWAFNEKTGEYKPFTKDLGEGFKPVFHLFETTLPMWSAFTADELPRPLGFLTKDTQTGEAILMDF